MNLKSITQLINKKTESTFTIRDIVICGMFSALLLVLQVALAILPNIELVSLFVIVYTLVFKRKTLVIIYTFALLEGLFYGFGIWWFMYLYVWTILYIIVCAFRKNDSSVFWAVTGGFFGLIYGALCSIPYLIAGGIGAGITWWIRGIPYDILHGVGNFIIILILFRPIYSVLYKMYYGMEKQMEKHHIHL